MAPPRGFKIDKQAIRKMNKEIEKEWAKNPIKAPVQASSPRSNVFTPYQPASQTTNNTYNGPVIHVTGDKTQIAFDNESVNQNQDGVQEVSAGYEELAAILTDLISHLGESGLGEEDQTDAQSTAMEVLHEITSVEPDRNIVRRGVNAIKGMLAPVALRAQEGAGDGVQSWAHGVVEQLTSAL